jgi:four helix bundle protein
MHTPLRSEILEQALSVVALASPLVAAIQRRDRDLASQVRRAVSSVGLNLAEAFGTAAGNERLRFETARGSLYEAQAGIRIAVAWGYFGQAQADPVLAAADRLGGRIYGLMRR